MKKLLVLGLTLVLLVPALVNGMSVPPPDEETPAGTMTVKSFSWSPEIVSSGDNKLLKATVDFHYEGDFITLGQDYYFSVTCRMNRQKRRGGYKMLYEESRDLSILDDEALEIEGPKDFSVPFTFTFFPHEFEAAKKRGVICDVSPSGSYGKGGGGGLTVTKFPEGMKTYGLRIRPKDGVWVVK